MRRARKEIKGKTQINAILAEAHVGRLGTTGKDGYPIIKPLNFVHTGGYVYFHSAMEGEKSGIFCGIAGSASKSMFRFVMQRLRVILAAHFTTIGVSS